MRTIAALTAMMLLAAAGLAAAEGDSSAPADAVATVIAPSSALATDGAAAAPSSRLSAALPTADKVVVRKAERRLYLMRHGEVLRSYRIALGLMPEGPKERAGDFRTPEGHYQLTRRNSHSDYFLSIQVSYPGPDDLRRARAHHLDPGGSIMLHGMPNFRRHPPDYYASADWTDGCIAMSNSDMVEVWLMTQDNVPIEILP